MNKDIVIYDIETATNGRINPETDRLRVFGAYSYKTDKFYYVMKKEEIRKILDAHKFLVGFNNFQYDNVVLYNNGFRDIVNINKYGDGRITGKFCIDLMQLFKLRAGIIKIKEGMLGDLLMRYSLDYITKTLHLHDEGGKGEFDYAILQKETWSSEEISLIKEYLKQDLLLTKKLYDWVEQYFDGFKEYVTKEDVENKKYLTCTPAVFAYKAICKELGLKEEYSSFDSGDDESYSGGYVSCPAGECFEDDIYCLDLSSAYPHAFASCNLFSQSQDGNGWHGTPLIKVNGYYNVYKLGEKEEVIMKFYRQRKEYKKAGDGREYTLKIIINSLYGASANPSFAHLYNKTTASDCTWIVRQWIFLIRKMFRDEGYTICYSDTDSVYIKDPYKDKERVMALKQKIVDTIQANVPLPQPTFDIGIEAEIKKIWFFKGGGKDDNDAIMDDDDFFNKPLGLLKKNYIYLTNDDKVVVKNLGVKKKSTSLLVREIFWKHIVPKIKEDKEVKFTKMYFRNLIADLLSKDLTLAAKRYQVNRPETYKNSGQIQCQIAKKYGDGIHFLIPNFKYGIGKGKLYCSIEEFKEKQMRIEDIDMENIWSELGYFIKEEKKINLSTWGM